MTIVGSCTIGSGTLAFPATAGTSLLTTAVAANTTLSVTCTNGSPYSIGMSNGANYATTRRMASGANYIGYALYLDAGLTQAWTTTTANSSCSAGANTCYLGTGNGTAQSVTVYGSVPIVAITPAAGTYSDTVTMTVTY